MLVVSIRSRNGAPSRKGCMCGQCKQRMSATPISPFSSPHSVPAFLLLFSNGNFVAADSIVGACSSTSSSAAASVATTGAVSGCDFRQWWVSPGASSATGTAETSYITYDEADHPADILPGGLWYT